MQITILIPTYNEEKHIRSCLVSVLHKIDQDVLEILVVDGLSTDSTPQIIDEIARINPLVKRLDNHHRTVPYALNIGIRQARGNYILRLDAHSTFPEDYISNCKAAMMKSNADNVGGVVVTHQNGESLSARLVQQVSTHIFGVGNARFRLRPRAQFADTVPFGFFKKSVFQQIGFFDERLTRNQDYELNARITKRGAGIWLDPTIEAHYKNQSTMRGLLKQALVTGKWNVWMWKVAPYTFKFRHLIPGMFAETILGLLLCSLIYPRALLLLGILMGCYLLLAFGAAAQQAVRYRFPAGLFLLPWCFLLYHLTYGLGIIKGSLLLLLRRSEVEAETRPWTKAEHYRALSSQPPSLK